MTLTALQAAGILNAPGSTMSLVRSANSSTETVPSADKIWAATWQNQQCGCAPNEDSDQPGHPPSLIRVFAVRMKKAWVLSYPLSAQRRLWLDWADAQADLSLRWAHTFCWFWHVVAHLIIHKQRDFEVVYYSIFDKDHIFHFMPALHW